MSPHGGGVLSSDWKTNLTILEVSTVVFAAFGLLAVLMALSFRYDEFSIVQYVVFSTLAIAFIYAFTVVVGFHHETSRIQDLKYSAKISTGLGLRQDSTGSTVKPAFSTAYRIFFVIIFGYYANHPDLDSSYNHAGG